MRSDERFIEEIFEKEKAKRTERKAARRRAVGICSSLALIFVIGIATVPLSSIFSAEKGDNCAEEIADTVTGDGYDAAEEKADFEYSKNEQLPGEPTAEDTEEDSKKNNMSSDNSYDDTQVGNNGEIHDGNQYSQSDAPDGEESPQTDTEKEPETDTEKEPETGLYRYLFIGAAVLVLTVAVSVLIVRKKRNGKDI